MNGCSTPATVFASNGLHVVLIEARRLNRSLLCDWLLTVWPGCIIDAVATAAGLPANPVGATNGETELSGAQGVRLIIYSCGNSSLRMPEIVNDVEALKRCTHEAPWIVLGDCGSRAEVAAALELGARGYVPTSLDEPAAARAIEFVLAGGIFVPANALAEVPFATARAFRTESPPAAAFDRATWEAPGTPALPFLTPREREVAACLCAGKPNKIIAHDLLISEATVKVFVRQILRKFGASNRTEAASAIRRCVDLADEVDQGAEFDQPVGRSKRTGTESRRA